MAVSLHVADYGLDGGTPSQFAFDDAEHAALMSVNLEPPPKEVQE